MALSKPVFFCPEDCGCEESIFDFHNQLKSRNNAVKFMQNHNLIDNDYNCERCGQKCCLDTIRFYWRCQKKRKMSSTEDKSFIDLDRIIHMSLKKALSQNTSRNLRRVRNYCTMRNIANHKRLSTYLKSAWCASESEYEDEGRSLLGNSSYKPSSYQEENNINNSVENPSLMKKAGRILLASLKAHAEMYNPALALDPQLPPSMDMIVSADWSSSIWNE
ncbi:unnamed protein product [Meganyctiphanes norvegica]|uniref:Uncharacterized protein n=1 Tax=Meganyctiphanes norvegica TaxID=48144 RepID=A0AAV2R304_MEGNR